jgi:hypothetical protein
MTVRSSGRVGTPVRPIGDDARTVPEIEDARPIAGIPLASEKAAYILGLKLAGVWNSNHRNKLAVAWGCTPDGVDKVAEKVNAVLARIIGDDPTRRLVVSQLLLALREVEQVADPARRIPLRVKIVAELSKVTGIVKATLVNLPGLSPPPPLSDDLLGAPRGQ